jgi:prepilin-type processing-associated H-X9-DG protein
MAQATVKTEQIADGAITAAKIADGAIVAAELASNSVTTAKIADDAVTSAKLDTNIAIAGTLDVAGAVVFNEGSADVDFRVESNGNANMLFVDGGNDRVGIGHSAPLFPLHKKTTTGYIMSETTDSSASAGYRLKADASADFTLFTTQGTNQFAIYDNANTAERLRIDSSGNVGIGANTSPVASASAYNTAALHLHQSQSGSYGSQIHLTNAATGAAAGDGSFISQWSDQSLYITNQENANIIFSANGSERARIGSSGVVHIGTTSDLGKLSVSNSATDEVVAGIQASSSSYANTILKVQCPRVTDDTYNMIKAEMTGHSTRFVVTDNGDVENVNNSYNGISDQRLKTNIADASSQWDDIKALKVRKFKMGMQPDDGFKIGVISQELEASGMNGLVKESDADEYQIAYNSDLGTLYTSSDSETQGDDATKKVGDVKTAEKVKRVKYSVLYMKAIKALQEAMTRIETLEAKVKTLEDA